MTTPQPLPTARATAALEATAATPASRICHIVPQTVAADDWPRVVTECATLGFHTLLVAPPFAVGAADDAWLSCDPRRLAPSLIPSSGNDDADAWLRELATLCSQHDLGLWLDWVVARFDGQAPVVAEHPEWFRPLGHADAPDPRVEHRARVARMAITPEYAEALAHWWMPQLDAWCAAGLSGLRCHTADALPARHWTGLLQHLREQAPDFSCMAWTPGLAAPKAAALGDAGFDSAACSLPWWDGSAAWLTAELANLRQHFRTVVAPLAPLARVPASSAEADIGRRRSLRQLTSAVAFADGWIVPLGLERGQADPGASPAPSTHWDIRAEITAANATFRTCAVDHATHWERLSDVGERHSAWLQRRRAGVEPACLLLLNNDESHMARVDLRPLRAAAACDARFESTGPGDDVHADVADEVMLEAGAARLLSAHPQPVIRTPPRGMRPPAAALRAPRIVIDAVQPSVACGRFAVRRCVGETVAVAANVFCDGHDMLAAVVTWRCADESGWQSTQMRAQGNDRYVAEITLARIGTHEFTIEAWIDAYGSYRQALEKKHGADKLEAVDIDEGRALIDAAIAHAQDDGDAAELRALRAALGKHKKPARAVEILLAPRTAQLMQAQHPPAFAVTYEPVLRIEAERRAARFASWYELFPRSQSGDEKRHGRFEDVIARLPYIADMGFDVLYTPPIHPIGSSKRKGRNNAPLAEPDDVGSPYAIGSPEGGHDALHSELGTFEDFQRLRDAAAAHGIELALDFAIQCSPDHPWIKQHPEWFQWRADGHIRHAENPPKVYEDIVNVDFHATGPAQAALWKALRDVVLFWVDQGVRLFRVDNPHTKPFPFWEWMIADVRARFPDVVFLAEAFTRPNPMYRLAQLGFSQSYTYFTWRNTKQELTDYFTELTAGPPREFFRPHLFVNTPDINPVFLQGGGRSAFLIRAALACTLSGLWGMYSGFEVCDAAALPGREEYLDSEKYQLRVRDWDAPGNIRDEIRQLNRLRHQHVELQTHLGLTFHNASDPHVLYFAKRAPGRRSMLLVAINLDPHADHDASIEVPLWEWEQPDDSVALWHNLLDDRRGRWAGKMQHVVLPQARPYAIWRIQAENP